jgi:hypothetical protein
MTKLLSDVRAVADFLESHAVERDIYPEDWSERDQIREALVDITRACYILALPCIPPTEPEPGLERAVV